MIDRQPQMTKPRKRTMTKYYNSFRIYAGDYIFSELNVQSV